MFTIPYVHIVQSMHAFKFLINTFFTMHGHASSSAISKRAYKQYAYFVSHIHASILSIFLFTHYIVVATQDRVFPHYVPNSSIKHSKSDSKDRSQEIL
jgi:hypothetical protein